MDTFSRFVKDKQTRPTPIGKSLLFARFIALRGTQISWNCFLRGKDFVWSIPKRIHGEYHPLQETVNAKNHVWVDGTPLSSMQVGYFNFVCETVRMLALDPRGYVVHVMVSPGGEAVLRERLSHDSLKLQCHPAGAGFLHDRQLPHAVIHFIKRFWRRCMHLRRASSEISATEILIWHGRFQFESSRKIAVIHDMTARLMPHLHTPGNVAEFEEFVRYSLRHADVIVTVSEHSRKDIIENVDVRPNSVRAVLSQVNPVYRQPCFSREALARHSLAHPYILCVGTIEPRKNLRRLVESFALLQRAGALLKTCSCYRRPPGLGSQLR